MRDAVDRGDGLLEVEIRFESGSKEDCVRKSLKTDCMLGVQPLRPTPGDEGVLWRGREKWVGDACCWTRNWARKSMDAEKVAKL